MIQLQNGCKYSINIFPKNWKTNKADLSVYWYIDYRYIDPAFKDKYPKGFTKRIKSGINNENTQIGRRAAIQYFLKVIVDDFENNGFNPITARYTSEVLDSDSPIKLVDRTTPFLKALDFALENSRGVPAYLMDIKSALRYIGIAARHFGYDKLVIYDVQVDHISNILEYCLGNNIHWSPRRHNKVKGELGGLFRYLIQKKAASNNAPRDVRKLVEKSKDRETLTPEQIKLVKKQLYDYNRPFYNFMMMFYYSGGRETELMKLKGRDVNLVLQTYKTEVLKGQQSDITRTIRTVSLPFWKEQMKNCKPDDYVFSTNLLPGTVQIHTKQISNRWKRWVKDPLSITADFYALKHLNAGQLVKAVGLEAAAAQLGHKSTEMVKKRYGKLAFEEKNHNDLKDCDTTL